MISTASTSALLPKASLKALPTSSHQAGRRITQLQQRPQLGCSYLGPSTTIVPRSWSSAVRIPIGRPPLFQSRPQPPLRASRPFASCSSRSSSSTTSSPSTSSSSSSSVPKELSAQQYHQLSEDTLESLFLQLEDVLETSPRASQGDWEVEYSQGVLTLKVPPTGTYVLNKQPANRQIWLSSPTSGPKRFDYSTEEGAWICFKEGQRTVLHQLLDGELSQVTGQPVQVLRDVLGGSAH